MPQVICLPFFAIFLVLSACGTSPLDPKGSTNLTIIYSNNTYVYVTNVSSPATNVYYTNAPSPNWYELTSAAPGLLPAAWGNAGAYHKGLFYLYTPLGTVLASSNARFWHEISSSAPNLGSYVFLYSWGEKLLVIPNNNTSISYESMDGIVWSPVSTNTFPRSAAASCIHQGRIFIVGGNNGSPLSDVLVSQDGVHWAQLTNTATFGPRYYHSLLSFKDRLWIFGGWTSSVTPDIWVSDNGSIWTQVSSNHSASKRYIAQAFVKDNAMHILAGFDTGHLNSHYSSEDGILWKAITPIAWNSRQNPALILHPSGPAYLLGGHGSVTYNDVWVFP